jgi:hypothetical protein
VNPSSVDRVQMAVESKADPDLVWEIDSPLLSRRVLGQWTGAMLATAAVMQIVLGLVFAAQGEWGALPMLLVSTTTVVAGLWLIGLFIMLVLFRGKYAVRYTLSAKGIRCDTIDRIAQKANGSAGVVGSLARSQQTLGAALIATSRESEEALWSGAFTASYDPNLHRVILRNSWRSLLWVQCTPENYGSVAGAIRDHMALRNTGQRARGGSPVPAYLGRTALVLASCFPLFLIAEELQTDLFLPLLTLCFGLATVWLINLFGWLVIGGLIIQIVDVVLGQLEWRESIFNSGRQYQVWELLDGNDIGLLALAGIGTALLVWISWSAISGRWLAALLQGYEDMGT